MDNDSDNTIKTILDKARNLSSSTDTSMSRQEVAKMLAEQFIVNRFANTNLMEDAKERVIKKLILQIDSIDSPRTLMSLITMLNQQTTVDLGMLTGNQQNIDPRNKNGQVGNIFNVNLGSNQSNPEHQQVDPALYRFMDGLIAAAESLISNQKSNEIIDVKIEDKK